ncbi:MAG TPA: efflux transporter outer membrane subunit [Candidatus Acidoferrales bacterium]|nr:efflux transporter outer membrane subunit [Candidatus Acidoferrales bacterium]
MKPHYLSAVALLAFLAGGCVNVPTVGPDYHAPETKTPANWSEPLAGGETNSAAATAAWWKNFHDSELDSLIERAACSNLDLRIAQARVREARAQYRIAAADFWPTLDASGSFARQRESKNQPLVGPGDHLPPGIPFENSFYQSGFDASWEIDVFGGTRRATEAAKAQVAATRFGERDVLVTLLGEVARNYVEARGYQRRLQIARDNIRAQEQSLAIVENRFTNGLTSNLDVQQANTVLATTRAVVPALETALAASIHRLGVLLGQAPESLETELAAVAPIPAAPPTVPVGLPSELLLRRPDVALAERQLAAATANIGVAKADLFPKFYLTGLAGFEGTSADDWFTSGSRFWSVGPAVQWRIFDAGRIRANVKVQNARQEQTLANYENTTLIAFEDVENALTAYAKEQIRRQQLEAAVKSSQESLRLANQLYANGLSNFINVLDAERSLYQAQDALVQSDKTVTTDLITLYKSLGGGWETNMRPAALALK